LKERLKLIKKKPDATIFRHLKKDHLLSGIDARIKLIVAIVLLMLVLSYKGFAFPLVVAILGFGLCLCMKITAPGIRPALFRASFYRIGPGSAEMFFLGQ